MRFSSAISLSLALLHSSSAFLNHNINYSKHAISPLIFPKSAWSTSNPKALLFSSSSGADGSNLDSLLEQAKLREAVNYLKEHPNTDLTKERWNKIFNAIEERTLNAEENTENLRMQAEFPIESAARKEMTAMYDTLRDQNHLRLYGAVSTTEPLAAGSHSVPPELMEKILDLPMQALTPQATNTIWIAGVLTATIEAITSFGTGIDFNFLVLLTLIGAVFDKILLNGAIFETYIKLFSPGVQQKILKHEANHLFTAYLLGCPVEGIVLSAWAALQDRRFGSRQVTAGTSFFDPELSKAINSGGQRLTRALIDRYSIIVMAGIAAEADQFGRADGGAGDEMALVAFLSRLNGNQRGTTTWDAAAIKNQARWGALQATLMMREYKPAYDALVDALESGGKLGDCIYAIEKAARDHNLKPMQQPVGYLVEGPDGQLRWDQNPKAESKKQETVYAAQEVATALRMSTEESLEVLQEYRESVEQRLRQIEQQLEGLQE